MPDFYFRDEFGRARAANLVSNLPLDGDQWHVVWRKTSEKRRDKQSRLMWAWYNEIQRHMAESHGIVASAEDWHETLCRKLMPAEVLTKQMPDGTVIEAGRWRSSKAGVKEMTVYLNKLDQYCAEELQLLLPHPNDLYDEAMSRR